VTSQQEVTSRQTLGTSGNTAVLRGGLWGAGPWQRDSQEHPAWLEGRLSARRKVRRGRKTAKTHLCHLQSVSPGEAEGLSIMRWQFTASPVLLRCLCKEAGDKEKRIGQAGGEKRHSAVGGAEGPTFTVVRPSNVKDLICPFSRKTFSTLGMRRRASFFNMSWHVGPATGEVKRMGGTERQREGEERE